MQIIRNRCTMRLGENIIPKNAVNFSHQGNCSNFGESAEILLALANNRVIALND